MMLFIAATVVMLLAVVGVWIGGCMAMRESACRNRSACPLTTTPPIAG